MTGGTETNSEDAPAPPPGPADRSWAHPSEVGLATRGHTDRRRSSLIATGVVLGGLGLLLSGVLLGAGQGFEPDTDEQDPTDRITRSIASVVVLRDGERSVATGLVIDDDGHLVVPAGAVAGAEQIWARCTGDEATRAEAVASDSDRDVAVLRLPRPGGAPATATGPDMADERVILVHATEQEPVATDATLAPAVTLAGTGDREPEQQVVRAAEDGGSGAGRFVFDRRGRLLGLTVAEAPSEDGDDTIRSGRPAPRLHSAEDLLDAAHSLIDER